MSAPEQPYWAPWVGRGSHVSPGAAPRWALHGQDHVAPVSATEQPYWALWAGSRGPRVSPGAGLLGTVSRTDVDPVSARSSPTEAVSRTVWIPCQPGAALLGADGQDHVRPCVSPGAAPLGALWPGPRGPCVSPRSSPTGRVGRTAWPHVSPGRPAPELQWAALGWDCGRSELRDTGLWTLQSCFFLSKPS